MFLYVLLAPVVAILLYIAYRVLVLPRFNVLLAIPGPPVPKWFGNHLQHVLNPTVTPQVHEIFVRRYGRTVRIRGLGPWDERLLTLDPVSFSHIVKNTAIYEKPWQSRTLITSLIGCGMLSAEGQMHKRQRRVALPAFSAQNMRSLVDISFNKGIQLRDTWLDLLLSESESPIEISQFLSRLTFDVIGLAGFDYNFNSIKDETNELFRAYKDMFEVAISQGTMFRTLLSIYLPTINRLFPDHTVRTVQRCQEAIHRVAGRLVQEAKQKLSEGEKSDNPYDGKDLLTLLFKRSGRPTARTTDIRRRHSEQHKHLHVCRIRHVFALNDVDSVSPREEPVIQDRLRTELLSVANEFPRDLSELTEDQVQSLHNALYNLPFLHNVTRESLRLIPPLHSTLRIATQDDEVPTMYPVHNRDGTVDETKQKHSFLLPKGTVVHLSVEAFNLDKAVWGEDAWEFNPDRWDNLPEAAQQHPWHFSNILTFSAGPRACPGLRFALIEMKTVYYILLTNLCSNQSTKISSHTTVLTRPYLSGKFKDGTQCPLLVSRYTSA
ncbi:cytochrome-450 hydroxylase [Mycena galopus ATCC 62051]|nr:cytochrome-450 hydroxylase [Mycena galopus ATCC 62051]